ncbi:MAG: hypothetical protein WBD20_27200 [Pirellulaceae bacterium]
MPQRTAPALIMSLVLHVILLTTIGIIWSSEPSGTGEEDDRPIGIAIVHQLPDRQRYVDAKDLKVQVEKQSDAEQQTDSSAASAAAPPADLSPPIDLAGILHAMESTPSPVSGTGLAGETQLGDDAFGTGTGKKSNSDGRDATTMVFGVSGSGSRFVYVFDRSDSMNGHESRPLRVAKAELIRSLKTLTAQQQFQIIFYNDKAKPFQLTGMPLQLIAAEPSKVALAERYVDSIAAFGGTEHDIALKLALRMSPDVIFFLTDARIPRLSGSELAEIRRRAEQSGTTIHAIEFGPEPGAPDDSFLRDLASQNNGQYKYIDVRRLGLGTSATKVQK